MDASKEAICLRDRPPTPSELARVEEIRLLMVEDGREPVVTAENLTWVNGLFSRREREDPIADIIAADQEVWLRAHGF